ncbi:protein ripply2.1-like [Pseudophryne corroboree]|uniref:protein ripply2.1-like n=1 Tax=Pseudophryne corroboree TaxID=495146 RepID=UPI0030818582
MEPQQKGERGRCGEPQQKGERGRSGSTADNARCGTMWRPWSDSPVTPAPHIRSDLLQSANLNQGLVSDKVKMSAFQHPVKLFWPKSKCYDFMYQEAEELLRNFPVQATISLYQESDSSSGSEDEDTIEN